MDELIGNTREAILEGTARWLTPQALQGIRATPAPIVSGAARTAVEAMSASL